MWIRRRLGPKVGITGRSGRDTFTIGTADECAVSPPDAKCHTHQNRISVKHIYAPPSVNYYDGRLYTVKDKNNSSKDISRVCSSSKRHPRPTMVSATSARISVACV